MPVDALIPSVLHLMNLTSLRVNSAVELVVLLPLFVAGFGCGFYVRDRILERRRSQYPVKPYITEEPAARRQPEPEPEPDHIRKNPSPRAAVPNRVRSVNVPQRSAPNGITEIKSSLPPDFDPVRINDELRNLLQLLPREERKKGP
jgi:hypothetical protein